MALRQPFSNPKAARDEPGAIWVVTRVVLEPRRPYGEITVAAYRDEAHAALEGAVPLDTREIAITNKPERVEVQYEEQDVDGVPTQVPVEVAIEAKPDYTRLFGTAALDVKDANPVGQAYAALKERPEFAEATDVLEELDAIRG